MSQSSRFSINEYISKQSLKERAGGVSYSRGIEYFEHDAVTKLNCSESQVIAKVRGTRLYSVKLWVKGNSLEYYCSCPLHESEGAFCKHCVAVGLAFLEEDEAATKPHAKPKALSMQDLEKYLLGKEKDNLVALLLDHAKNDIHLLERLRVDAASQKSYVHFETMKRAIDNATTFDDEYYDYNDDYGGEEFEKTEELEHVINSLRKILGDGHIKEALELSEYFLSRLENVVNAMHDRGIYPDDTVGEVLEIHHDACKQSNLDPEALAEKLFHWEVRSKGELFFDPGRRYADVLGKVGMKKFQSLVEEEWNKLPPLRPKGDEFSEYGRKLKLFQRMMESIAEKKNDVEQMVAIKAKTLTSGFDYLEIARIYKKTGLHDKALEWAERGAKTFPQNIDSELMEFLANEYHRRKRHEEAIQLYWHQFTECSWLENYKLLKIHAERGGGAELWQEWRAKAIVVLQEQIRKDSRKKQHSKYDWYFDEHTTLVEIYLWEGNVEQAWIEAQSSGCNDELWITLATKREPAHPEDALAVFLSLVEPQIKMKNNEGYQKAIKHLKKVKALMVQLNSKDDWAGLYYRLKTEYHRCRNFIKLLEKIE